ncbi:MAG: FMN-binding protein [Victivallales bacterium]|nr:FMN-binding protein [Victivallales bacterium]
MKDILRLCVSLGLVCLVGAGALAYVNNVTDGPRKAAAKATLTDGLKLVLPLETATIASNDEEGAPENEKVVVIDGVKLYRAYDAAGNEIAVAAEAEGKGFGGMVKTLTGIGKDGRIIHVIVTSHSETPGLGTQATDRKMKKSIWGGGKALAEGELPPNPYLDGKYNGKDAKPFSAIDGVSGATYSSTAVHNAVNKACRAYGKYKAN